MQIWKEVCGKIVYVEVKSGDAYLGKLKDAEGNMNLKLKTVTAMLDLSI